MSRQPPFKAENTAIIDPATVQLVRTEACLIAVTGTALGKRFPLNGARFVIGRSPDCEISVEEEGISRMHAEVIRNGAVIFIRDLKSTNGTWVNNNPVVERRLNDGDQIRIGKAIFKFLESDNLEAAYHDAIYQLTTTDELTRVFNRRHFFATMQREVARAIRHKRHLSVVMIDVDFFKRVNDTWGHAAGDGVLFEVARRLSALCREEHVFARYGGEEFSALLPELDKRAAVQFARAARHAIADAPIEVDGHAIPVTISLGVAEIDETGPLQTVEATEQLVDRVARNLLRVADQRLYIAKEKGRNCVVV